MRKIGLKLNILIACILAIGAWSCNNHKEKSSDVDTAQTGDLIFPKGEKVTNNNFTGTVWLQYLVQTDSVHHTNIGSVTFEPGARTNWHMHKGGQILLVTAGQGLYQEKGKAIEYIKRGDVLKCPPNVAHWHGASPTQSMTHIAIGTNTNIGGAIWLEPVTDEEYNQK
jgi:quercetin dioxygenase-like cupin family protein